MVPTVHARHDDATGTWSYVVADPATLQAALIDPLLDHDAASGRNDSTSARALLEIVATHGYDVRWILDTHTHADHLSAAHWLRRQLPDATLAMGAGITSVQRAHAERERHPAPPASRIVFDQLLHDGERFALGTLPARAIAVPGHTSDSTAYLIGNALFTGDSLLMPDAGTARCDFPGGDAALLFRSIAHLFHTLPDSTRVFVCHDYAPGGRAARCESTIGEQRRDNIHVREGTSPARFVAMRTERDAGLPLPALITQSLRANLHEGGLPHDDADATRVAGASPT